LAHGKAYSEIKRALTLQSFTLFYGYPWSHADVYTYIKTEFPDSVWINANTFPDDIVTFYKDCTSVNCHIGKNVNTKRLVQFSNIPTLRLEARRSVTENPFPCNCTEAIFVDYGNVWCCSEYNKLETYNRSCFKPISRDVKEEKDIVLYVDWEIQYANVADKCKNIAYVCESEVVVPGCKQFAITSSNKFSRVYQSLSEFSNIDSGIFGSLAFGGCWIPHADILEVDRTVKLCQAGLIYSDKQWAIGHSLRHSVANKYFTDSRVARFGSGTGKRLTTKSVAHVPYMYSIVIENCRESGYWTEKLVDALISKCVVFYWGAPDVHRTFDSGSVIPFGSMDDLEVLLSTMSERDYSHKKDAIELNWHRAMSRTCYLNNLALDTDLLSLPVRVTKCQCTVTGISFGSDARWCQMGAEVLQELQMYHPYVKSGIIYDLNSIPTYIKDLPDATRGYKYWIWKPYLVLKTFESMSLGDVVIYSDTKSKIVGEMKYATDFLNDNNLDLLAVILDDYCVEQRWTTGDLLDKFGVKINDTIATSNQYMATMFIVRKSAASIKFMETWLAFMLQNYAYISFRKSSLPDSDIFIENRNDQSVFSLLLKTKQVSLNLKSIELKDTSPYYTHQKCH